MKPVPTPVHFPLAYGLDSKTHPFALDMPRLSKCENGVFTEPGSIQKRPGHTTLIAGVTPAVTLLTSGKATGNAFDVLTASVSPTANRLVLIAILIRDSGVAGSSLGIDGVTGNGLTWAPEESVVINSGTPGCKLFLYRALGSSPSAGQIDIALTDTGYDTVEWAVVEASNVSTSGTSGSGAVPQSVTATGSSVLSLAATMGAFSSASSVTVSFFGTTSSDPVTHKAGWTELADEQQGSGTVAALEAQWIASADPSPSATFPNAVTAGCIAVEIAPPSPGLDIAGGGTLSNIRGLAKRKVGAEEELLCFAEKASLVGQGKLFTWSPADEVWYDRGDYEGVELTQVTRASFPGEQTLCDRAENLGVILVAYVYASLVRYQLFDKTTGGALCVPKNAETNSTRPRCLAVGTKLHLYWHNSSTNRMRVRVIDPTDVNGTLSAAAQDVGNATAAATPYDVCKRTSTTAVMVYRNAANQYDISQIASDGTSSTTAKALATQAGSALGVAYEPNLDRVAVIRSDGANFVGDILNGTTYATVSSATVIDGLGAGTIERVAVAFRETAESGGTYRAVILYDRSAGTFECRCKYFGTDAATGAVSGPSGATVWAYWAHVGGRAFARGAKVYFMVLSTSELTERQWTYLVYREDGLLIARFSEFLAPNWTAGTVSPLPQVEDLGDDSYAFMATVRTRAAPSDGALDYFADQDPLDVVIDFDSDAPYRGVQQGLAVYFPGGYVMVYDGLRPYEAGHFHAVTCASPTESNTATGALTATGVYKYRLIPEWRYANGEIERGTWIDTESITLTGVNDTVTLTIHTLPHTRKYDSTGAIPSLSIVVFRTIASGADFYRVSSADSTTAGTDNGYVSNDPTASQVSFVDVMADATLLQKERLYTDLTPIDNVAPSACSVIAVGQGRVFLAGHKNESLITYSKIWQGDEVVEFFDGFQIILPQEGGGITAIAVGDGFLIAWKEHRVYYIEGTGADNVGAGNGYSDPRLLSADTGAVDGSPVVLGPDGWFFVSHKGIRLLDRGFQVQDIGAPVDDYKTQSFTSALLLEDKNLILFVTDSGSTLAYDYFVKQWSTWTNPVGVAAVSWNGVYVYATSSNIFKSTTTKTDAGTSYSMTIRTPWVFHFGRTGFGMVWEFEVLGEYVAAHNLRVKVYFNEVGTVVDSQAWTVDTTRYIVKPRPSQKKLRSIMVEISDESDGTTLADSFKAVALSFLVGVEQGLSKLPSSGSM